jgi:rhamnopyranosyl-N-acetylglucosaminyl-diphospho-decaprenol beta-1,3/1,4-galactofuranosyltransferase
MDTAAISILDAWRLATTGGPISVASPGDRDSEEGANIMITNIAAIVVTHNRKVLLARCLESLTRQTRVPNLIILVDNASMDGTEDYLRETGLLVGERVRYVRLPHNVGSGGGFARGMQAGLEAGADWLWIMDDDGIAEPNCLEELLSGPKATPGYVFNSVVIAPNGKDISFGYHLYEKGRGLAGSRCIKKLEELEALNRPVVKGLAQFFNSSLIHRQVVEAVGLPREGFFIRGDELEYVLRIQSHGFDTITVVASHFTHPDEQRIAFRFFGYVREYPVLSPMKQYYLLRNTIIISKQYGLVQDRWSVFAIRQMLSYLILSLISPEKRIRRVMYTLLAYLDGILGRVYSNTMVR